MKNALLIFALFCIVSSCKKDKVSNPDTTPPPAESVLISPGSFTSNAHPTSGTVQLRSHLGTKTLVFGNFKTDNGPDLWVYLSTTTGIANFKSLGKLKSTSGNFTYNVDSTINTTTHKFILIWCKDFSVLFGHAVLQ